MYDIELTNPDEINLPEIGDLYDKEALHKKLSVSLQENIETIQYVCYIYNLTFHILVFSVFESFFFWFYITDQENKVLKNQLKDVVLIGELICSNVNIDVNSLIDYIKDENKEWNNRVPLHNTLLMNGTLTFLLLGFLTVMKCKRVDLKEVHIKIAKNQGVTFLFLFLYEYFFFQNVIYTYHPTEMINIYKKAFHLCLQND